MAESTRKKEFVQYSKKMCTGISLFWMLYRIANFIVALLRPEISTALVDLSAGVDTIMIVNMGVYTGNSATEKIAIAFGKRPLRGEKNEDEESEEDSSEESDEENG